MATDNKRPISTVLIFAAMDSEANPIVDHFKLSPDDGSLFPLGVPWIRYHGNYKDLNINVIYPGKDRDLGINSVGTVPASLVTYASIQALKPDLLINAGTAGAFKVKGACIFDVFLVSDLAFHDRRIPIPGPDKYGLGRRQSFSTPNLVKELNLKVCKLSTGDSLDMCPQDETCILANDATIVDMEGAALAYVSNLMRVPAIYIKAVSNFVDGEKSIPEEFAQNLQATVVALREVVAQVIEFLNETLNEIIWDMEENLIMYKTDRISQLPECIVHHILSFLDPLERVQMSLLSKEWFSLTASFPILESDINDNLRYKSDNNVRDMFYKYVEYSTSRFLEQNVSAHIYNITTDLMKPEDVDILDKCLGLILKKGVQVLKIYIPDRLQSLPMYRLPNIPVLSSSTLTSLNINSCELPSSLLVDDLEFKSLKKLFLYFVQIDEKILKYLISSCPLLEIFNVGDCYGFKTFCVCGHQKLQKVRIRYKHEVERIDIIEVPNLCYLLLNDLDGRGETSMNLSSCKKLTTVSYNGYPFTNFLSNFPFIENFYLKPPGKRENLKLSSPTLKTFVLYSQYNMDKINIDAPNLISFKYNGSLQMLTSLVSGPSNSKTRMECYCNKNDLNLWLKALWRFLLNNTGFILWELHISTKLIDIAPKVSLPLHYELEHVTLDLKNKLSIYVDAVDGVLWFFRPRCLTLKSNLSFWSKNDVKRVHKSLLQQENEDRTNIQIVLPSSSRGKKHFSNMNAYLKASPNDLLNEITFIKEEVAEEPIHTVVQETDAWDLWLSFFFE